MTNQIWVTGYDIYTAAVNGANRGYNRSNDDHQVYEQMIAKNFEILLDDLEDLSDRNDVMASTGNDWRRAYFPLEKFMDHCHIAGKPSDVHARVIMPVGSPRPFDIPMDDWEYLTMKYENKISSISK